ncbi:MAG: hypothetical protein FWH15_05255 [Betaproteobacteria bacterium]|nr:hypothetical protein [Betaproteobacteria bacterium]
MTKILYRATSSKGVSEADYVEAETEKEAVAKLKAEGYADIMLYESALTARLLAQEREIHDSVDAAARKFAAASEIAILENPCWKTLIKMSCGAIRACLLIIAVCVAGAVWLKDWWPLVVAIMPLAQCGWLFFRLREVMWFTRFNKAFAVGDWDAVQRIGKCLPKTRTLQRVPGFSLYVALSLAQAEIAEAGSAALERLPDVLQRLEEWRDKSPAPGSYEVLLAAVYCAVGDYPTYIKLIRQVGEAQRSNPVFLVEWAFAEARLGDTAIAACLLAEIDQETLCWDAQMLYPYIAGMIALRENRNEEALVHLQAAVSGYLLRGKNPYNWPMFACCAGACAVALARAGQNEAAKDLVRQVWPMLSVHGAQPLLTMIEREVMN